MEQFLNEMHIKHLVQGDERVQSISSSVCVEFLAPLNAAFEWIERIQVRGKAVIKKLKLQKTKLLSTFSLTR